MDDELKGFIHGLNAQSFSLNKHLVQKSATMQDIPLNKDIYGQPEPHPTPPQPSVHQQPQVSQPVLQQVNTDPNLLNELIDRVSSVEKQITKFVDLIERRVAKNAKEINIRIKLNE